MIDLRTATIDQKEKYLKRVERSIQNHKSAIKRLEKIRDDLKPHIKTKTMLYRGQKVKKKTN